MLNARARLADALVRVIEADPRVIRLRRLEFAHDGGVVVSVELHAGTEKISGEVMAREIEFLATIALPKLTWVRVRPVYAGTRRR